MWLKRRVPVGVIFVGLYPIDQLCDESRVDGV